MFRFSDTHQRGLTLSDVANMFRRPKPLPEHMRARECVLAGCHEPAMQTAFMCEPHEIADRIGMYDPDRGWGDQS